MPFELFGIPYRGEIPEQDMDLIEVVQRRQAIGHTSGTWRHLWKTGPYSDVAGLLYIPRD